MVISWGPYSAGWENKKQADIILIRLGKQLEITVRLLDDDKQLGTRAYLT
jgi:hypothetical protein